MSSSYELFEPLGNGQHTVVYRGYDLTLQREVAIKELNESSQRDERRVAQFLQEASFLAQFEHENVLRIYSVERDKGWIVMELMRGTLAQQIAHQPYSAEMVRSVLRQVLTALDFLHAKGKVHGSVRPTNILINNAGTAKLSDFDAAEADGELRVPTGSKKYLAPEMIRPQFGSFGPSVDLYCLGFTALELLAGPKFDSLFPGTGAGAINSDTAWLRWHSSEEQLASVKKLVPSAPDDLAAVIDSLLAKHVDQRPATAADVLKSLDDTPVVPISITTPGDDGSPTVAPLVGGSVREVSPVQSAVGKEDQLPPLPSGGVSLPRVATKANAAAGRTTASTTHGTARSAAAVGEELSTKDRVNEFLGRPYILYPLCASILLVALFVGWKLNQTDDGLTDGDEIAQVVDGGDETEAEPQTLLPILSEAETDPAEQIELIPNAEPELVDSQLIPDQDVTEPVQETDEPELVAIDEREQQVTDENETEPELTVEDEAVEVEEEQIALVNPDEFQPITIDTSELDQQFQGRAELVIDSGGFISEIVDVAISPDTQIVAACGAKEVRLWSTRTGDLLATLRGDRSRTSYGNCNCAKFSPDGRYLVVGVNDYRDHGSIRVYDLEQLDEIESLLPGHQAPCSQLAFSRDGVHMVSIDSDGQLIIWDWENRRILQRVAPRDPKEPITDMACFPTDEPYLLTLDFEGPQLYSIPDGKRLSPRDQIPEKVRAWLMDMFTGEIKYPYDTKKDPRVLNFRMDQDAWASAGVGREGNVNRFWVGVWPTRKLNESSAASPILYSGHRWTVTAIELSGDPTLAVSGDKFGEVHVWNPQTGKRLHRFRGQGKSIYEVAFDRSDKRIAFGTTPFPPSQWDRNSHGNASKVIDLASRSVVSIDQASDGNFIQEQTTSGDEKVTVAGKKNDPSLYVRYTDSNRPSTEYRLSTGRNPTVLTLLDEPKLGVQRPVVFGDNEGMLVVWDPTTDELRRAFIGHESLVSAISPSANGKLLVSSSTDRTLRIWSLEDQVPTGTFDFKYENSRVIRVEAGSSSARAGVQVGDQIVAIDGKSLTKIHNLMLEREFKYQPGDVVTASMSRGQQTYEYEMQMVEGYDFSEPVLNVFIGDDDQWIIWTPQGYYDSSPGADQLIGWHVNRGPDKSARFYSVQQFRKQLHRPDVINRILETGNADDGIRLADEGRRHDLPEYDFRDTHEVASHHPPRIMLRSKERIVQSSDGKFVVRASVQSENRSPIKQVTVLVNGTVSELFQPDGPRAEQFEVEHPLSLTPGRHELRIVAANSQSSSVSDAIIVEVAESARSTSPDKDRPRVFALAIGTSGGLTGRTSSGDNAKAFAAAVESQKTGKLYGDVQVRTLADEQATRRNVEEAIQWLVESASREDVAILFVSTVGLIDGAQNHYLAASDTDPKRARATAVSWREFVRTLHEDLLASKRILFLDMPIASNDAVDFANPLADLAVPELGAIFFARNPLEVASAQNSQRVFADALNRTLSDPTVDRMPKPADSMLTAIELNRGLTNHLKKASGNRQQLISYVPNALKNTNLLELRN